MRTLESKLCKMILAKAPTADSAAPGLIDARAEEEEGLHLPRLPPWAASWHIVSEARRDSLNCAMSYVCWRRSCSADDNRNGLVPVPAPVMALARTRAGFRLAYSSNAAEHSYQSHKQLAHHCEGIALTTKMDSPGCSVAVGAFRIRGSSFAAQQALQVAVAAVALDCSGTGLVSIRGSPWEVELRRMTNAAVRG